MGHAIKLLPVCLVLVAATVAAADPPAKKVIDDWKNQPDEWFKSEEGQRVIANVISWQNPNGGWWKAYNTLEARPADAKSQGTSPHAPKSDINWSQTSTFDNGATFSELRFLARARRVTGRQDAEDAFRRGLNFVFASQYPHGGWPQRFPLEDNYGRHVTFNDGAMAGVMKVLRDAAAGQGDFAWLDEPTRAKCKSSFDRGVDCILKCQVVVDGTKTVWCQQHDADTLAATSARTFEVASLCSTESAEITQMLMDIEKPDDRVKQAVDAAVAWFERSKILGKRYDRIPDPSVERGVRRELHDDPSAAPLWARFYDIATNKPFVVDRDGSIHDTPAQISAERRNGYAWYSTSPAGVLKRYPKWKEAMRGTMK